MSINKDVSLDTDLISRQVAIDALTVYIQNIDKVMGNGLLSIDDCRDCAESVLGVNELPPAQPEIIRCKDCARYVPSESEFKKGMCDGRQVSKRHFCGYAKRRANDGK